MNSRETGCLGVAAALALSALAGDAAAEEAAVSQTPASPAARPRSAPPTHIEPKAREQASTSATRPQLARTLAASSPFDAPLAPLMPPLTPVVPVAAAAPLPGSDLTDSELREQHIREAPEVPAPGSPPVRATTEDETPPRATTSDEAALEVAERLLGDGVPLQLLQTVIVPAARGVTIAEIQTENVGAVTLSVRPTKITRGSGLVAVGRF